MVRSAITLCTLILVTTAACSADIDTYKQSVWSDEALDGVLDEFSHVVGEHCELESVNSTCAEVSSMAFNV